MLSGLPPPAKLSIITVFRDFKNYFCFNIFLPLLWKDKMMGNDVISKNPYPKKRCNLNMFDGTATFPPTPSLIKEGVKHVDPSNNIRRAAFTLAEVLITLGIIGVVAAMTMPSVVTKYREKETVVKLKRFYSTFSNAVLRAQNDNELFYQWGITKDDAGVRLVGEKLKPYNNVIKDCGVAENAECSVGDENGKVQRLNGSDVLADFATADYYKFRINDGSAVEILPIADCITPESRCMEITIDINGYKKPNTLGKDVFYFEVYGNGKTLPYGVGKDPTEGNESGGWAACSWEGWQCTAWVVFKENMDYLRCPEELQWNGKSSCK